MRHPLLVVYDIADDRRRSHLRGRLRPLGDWVQQSAWVVPPTPGLNARRVLLLVRPALSPGDRVRIYEPCPACLARARWAPPEPAPLAWPPIRIALPGT
jgi:CRISPR-associated endonuclease Cas2